MIKAKKHQQQPPTPAYCPKCREGFNNQQRLNLHLKDKEHL